MDKLQPIIQNRFWILAGLVLPLAMYGFYSANSSLSAATQSREEALKSALSNIPSGTNDANEEYAAGLAKINETYAETVEKSIIDIWNRQAQLMTWPPVVDRYVPELFLGEFDYRGIVAYQEAYERLMRDLQTRVQPVMPLERRGGVGGGPTGAVGPMGIGPMGPMRGAVPPQAEKMADVPWKQKVVLAASIPQARFGRMRATSQQVWNAQIDIWMTGLLFDAIARLNDDKDSVTESVLRRLDVLRLFGGDGQPIVTGGAAPSGGTGDSYGGGEEAMYGMEMEAGMNQGLAGDGGAERGIKALPINFDPKQEFGSDADPNAAPAGGGGGGSEYPGGEGGFGGGGMRAAGPKLRYIADADDKPFYERGFYMSVIIMQNKIPDFLVELANSEWPVRVTRFHVGKNPYYKPSRSTGGRNLLAGGGYGGAGYGGAEYGSEIYETEGSMGNPYGGMEGGSGSPFGGAGAQAPSIPGVGGLTKNLPAVADAAMQHPNLVQLDLCGVITMYKQPQSIVTVLEAGGAVPASSDPAVEVVPIDPEDLNAEPGDPNAAPLTDDPAENSPTPADDPAASPTDPAEDPTETASNADSPQNDSTASPTDSTEPSAN